MGNKNDGQNKDMLVEGWPNGQKPIVVEVESSLQKNGRAETKVLVSAYNEFSKDGLTNGELEKLKRLDEVLDGVKLELADSSLAHIVQEGSNQDIDFLISGSDLKASHLTSKPKAKRTK